MSVLIWVLFLLFIVGLLLLDLGVFHRKAHEIQVPEALAWPGHLGNTIGSDDACRRIRVGAAVVETNSPNRERAATQGRGSV